MISQQTLESLKNCKPYLLHKNIMTAAIELGLTDRPISDSSPLTRDLFTEVWESVLDHLDQNYPGWRGYPVRTVDGTII